MHSISSAGALGTITRSQPLAQFISSAASRNWRCYRLRLSCEYFARSESARRDMQTERQAVRKCDCYRSS